MDRYGSDRDPARARLSPSALAGFARHLALHLPKSGGLIGSGRAQFMANRALTTQFPAGRDPVQAAQLQALARADRAISASQVPIAASLPSRWPIPVPGCASCHGPRQPPAPPPTQPRPPADDPWTYYPDISLRKGGGWGRSPSRSNGDDRKHCDLQEQRDNAICRRQVAEDPAATARLRAVCHASKMERYSWCQEHNELGKPRLNTYRQQAKEASLV